MAATGNCTHNDTSTIGTTTNDTDTTTIIMNDDWEEWDGTSPFWIHCVAGSIAGVVEHTTIFPLDTVRTHIQVCASCIQRNIIHNNNGNASTSSIGSSSTTSSLADATAISSSNSGGSSILRSSSTLTTTGSTSSVIPPATSQQQRLPLGMMQTIRYLVNEPILSTAEATASSTVSSSSPSLLRNLSSNEVMSSSTAVVAGWSRLFRGIQTVLIGCVPAHALYFSSYEIVKAAFSTSSDKIIGQQQQHSVSTLGSSLAGAAAVTSHDIIMTPIDTVKQRLQIGHYQNAKHAAQSIYYNEGFMAFYRSFPITLISNVPYGMVMVTTHEACKEFIHNYYYNSGNNTNELTKRPHQWQIVLLSSSIAGLVASAVTTPLDRIKTALQTQQLTPICGRRNKQHCPLQKNNMNSATAANASIQNIPKHINWRQAAQTIYKEEGMIGFWRGILPRILSHTPAVAISWTTYETVKQYLLVPSSLSH